MLEGIWKVAVTTFWILAGMAGLAGLTVLFRAIREWLHYRKLVRRIRDSFDSHVPATGELIRDVISGQKQIKIVYPDIPPVCAACGAGMSPVGKKSFACFKCGEKSGCS